MANVLLEDIAAYLATEATLATATIRTGRLPASPDSVIVVQEYGGVPPNTGFGTPGLKDEMPGVAIRVRGDAEDYATPRATIQLVYRHMAKLQAMTLGTPGVFYRMARAQQAPFPLELDSDRRHVFGVNYLIEKEF